MNRTFVAEYHKTIINTAGVILIGYPNEWGARFEPGAAITHAKYILEHEVELKELQSQLEQTWNTVALELKERFERGEGLDDVSFAEASSNEIQSMLEVLSGQDASGYKYAQEPQGLAGSWYRSMWDEEGESISYEQQWTPFLRICEELQKYPVTIEP